MVDTLWTSKREAEAAAGCEAPAAASRLDPDTCKVTSDDRCLVALPAWTGGKLCPVAGRGKRIADLKCFEQLAQEMRQPVFITLTINRENWRDEQAGYLALSAKLPDFMRHLGIKVWGRVYEVQTKSGGGWIHAHIVADLAGSGLQLRTLAKRSWKLWRDRWAIGGCDIQRAKSRKGVAGYMAMYLTKAWPAIPPWMLKSRRPFRLVGFSRAASKILQEHGLKLKQQRRPRSPFHQRRKRRPPRPLIDRLAMSGMSCNVFERWRKDDGTFGYKYIQRLPFEFSVLASSFWPGIRWDCEHNGRKYQQFVFFEDFHALQILQRSEHIESMARATNDKVEWRKWMIEQDWDKR